MLVGFKKYARTVSGSILIVLLTQALSSCFSKFVWSDEKTDKFYRQKPYRPVYHFLEHNGKQIHYAEFGNHSKPLLILIHGAPGAWYTWRNIIDLDTIRSNFHIIAIDRPGYGKSGGGKFEPQISVQIEMVQQIINQYPGKEIYLAGRSYGAPIATALASQNKLRTRRLLLYSPVLSPFHEKTYWFSSLGKKRLIRRLLPDAMNVATDEKFAHLSQMKTLLQVYPGVEAETCIISGDKDWVAHPENFKVSDSLLCNAKKCSVLVKNNGHFLTFLYPKSMSMAIYEPFCSDFAERLTASLIKEGNSKENR